MALKKRILFIFAEDEVNTLQLKYPNQNITTNIQIDPHPGKEAQLSFYSLKKNVFPTLSLIIQILKYQTITFFNWK